MQRNEVAAKRLESLSKELAERGQPDIAQELNSLVDVLRSGVAPEPEGGVMTTGEAAKALGIRSVNTVKRWATQGLLTGYRRGGRIMVSSESVARLAARPEVAVEREKEMRVAEALAPFDAGNEETSDSSSAATWVGRKPWAKSATAKA